MNDIIRNSSPTSSSTSIPDNVTVEGLRLALEEMRMLYEQRFESSDALDKKAGTLLSSASLVLSIVTTLQLTQSGPDQPWFYWFGLFLAFGLYIGMITLTVIAITPKTYTTPIKADWNVLDQRLFQNDEQHALLNLIKAYMDRNNASKTIIKRKANQIRWAGGLLAIIVVLLSLLSLVIALGLGT